MKNRYDIVVIGGGASGLVAARVAVSEGCDTLLLEKMEKCGRKVRITGKGRCNITNMAPLDEFLSKVRSGAEFVRHAVEAFDARDVERMLNDAGVETVTERGRRLFPKSGRAVDVAEALVRLAVDAGAEIACHSEVVSITADSSSKGEGWRVEVKRRDGRTTLVACRCVIIATGGVSYRATGSTGDGYLFAHRLGHTIVPLRPSLVSLRVYAPEWGGVKEQLRNISLSLSVDGRVVAAEQGEMSIDGDIFEGAVVLRLSRDAVDALTDKKDVSLTLSLKPALSVEQTVARIGREIDADPSLSVGGLLRKLTPKSMVTPIARMARVEPTRRASSLDEAARRRVASLFAEMRFRVVDYGGFAEAVTTAGGVSLDEVCSETMESKIAEGVFFAGETLDIDANTGGYNLQLAFSTGFLCGKSAADKVKKGV